MNKYIDLSNEYLRSCGTGSDPFSTRIIRAIINEAKSNPQLTAIGFEHRNILFDHEYPNQFAKIAEQKEYLNIDLIECCLNRVQLSYWVNSGPQNKMIWERG